VVMRRLEAPQTEHGTEPPEPSELDFGMNAIESTHKEVIRDSASDRSAGSVSKGPNRTVRPSYRRPASARGNELAWGRVWGTSHMVVARDSRQRADAQARGTIIQWIDVASY